MRSTAPARRLSVLFVSLCLGSALLAAPAGAVPAAPAPASAVDTVQVVLAGSLQSELGCAQDWDPACEASALEPSDDGSTYTATFELPAGSYAYKIAVGGSWDDSHGGGADGTADIPLHLENAAELVFSYDRESHAIGVAPAAPAEPVGAADEDLAGDSLRADLTRERFYFVMADRFANGDRSNDRAGIPGDRTQHGFDPTDKGWFHGGDVAGLRNRLDYIEGLGTTAIWLTPSFENRPVQGAGENASAGYHGYWVTDFTRLDPHFGTNAEFEEFVDAAHERGIKVFFDIITNHTADVIDYAEGEYGYVDKATQPYRDASGQPFDDRDFVGSDDFPELDAQTSFPYTPVFRSEADATVKVPAWLNDPTMYHNRGDSTFAGESSLYGDFVGLDDLFTEHPDVVEGMTDIYRTWVDFGIDGYRIDTAKHVNMEFWQEFGPAIEQHAQDGGNPDFFSFGEVFDADPAVMSEYTTRGRLQATLDFGFQSAGVGFAGGRPTTQLRDFFARDDYYTDTDSNAYSLPTFLGNHDMGRVGWFLREQGTRGRALQRRHELAHSLMFLTRGQPVVYYGDEQGFVGDGGDKDARQDMFPSRVASYNDDDLIGTDTTTADANFDRRHPLYRHIAELAALRERFPALADGAQLHRYASADPGVYAFSRIGSADREFVVAVNNAATRQRVELPTSSPRTELIPVAGGGAAATTDRDGRVGVTVPALSYRVWRARSRLPERANAPAVFFDSPSAGGVVGGPGDRAEVGVSTPGPGPYQVTPAWRHAGQEGWTPLGTDDNAPYRVFHDVADLPDGALVEYRAVLRDRSGNLSVAQTYGTVGDAGGGGDDDDGGTGPVTQPDAVSVPGSLSSEMGCPGDWQPDCDAAQLALDANDEIWKKTVELPAGDYEYKAAIDRSWDENYGAGGVPGGANIGVTAPGGPVSFFYDHRTHHVTSDAQGPIVTAPGSFTSALGCAADWDPACMRSWLQDPDGDGVHTFSTDAIPAGSHEVKVAHGLSWEENYGAGGAPDGANIGFTVEAGQVTSFRYDLATHVLTVTAREAGPAPDLSAARAHWVERGLVALEVDQPERRRVRLTSAPEGGLAVDDEALVGGSSVRLRHVGAGLPDRVLARFPQLAGHEAYRIPARVRVRAVLRGQAAVSVHDGLGRLVDATGVQSAGVLDDVYAGAADRTLGLTWPRGIPLFALWAPTAQDVRLLVQPRGRRLQRVPMRLDRDGVWTADGKPSWRGATYRYAVRVYVPELDRVVVNRVTDPYALALTTNSERGLVTHLDDPSLAPQGWAKLRKPTLARPEDANIYELHVRDFSIGDASVPARQRGTYAAFTQRRSDGMRHLRRLADAGMTTVHVLPVFDIATIEERRESQATPDCDLASYPPDSTEQQACVEAVRERDGFNWGYDPYHYTVPEGSYATDPDGARRTREFRSMVAALNRADLGVVMDVVYNHTAQAGQSPRSTLDKMVPGYYHRLSLDGALETSTCCPNTATEHTMMGKLMVDSVLTWARDYKVDGFRFDLMGHQPKALMVALRAELDRLTVRRDGVDGSSILLYGEGWDFGEVAGDALFEQATQANMAGTGIATFSDRLRDAVRGGGPFDETTGIQGLATGLFTDPNGNPANGSAAEQRERLLDSMDLVKVGLAGNLADYEFTDSRGAVVTGAAVDYNGSPAGYAADPGEVVTYVDAHDNEALYDTLALKLPPDTPMADRVRMNTLALSTATLSQSITFWHAGADLLRSKSLDRNSYDSGDWFNRVDWTRRENTFGSGLPLAADNEDSWHEKQPLLADPDLRPAYADMTAAHRRALDLLRIRSSSRLFRLGTAQRIQAKVDFPVGGEGSVPGLVVMRIDDTAGADLDPRLDGVVVVFNATPAEQSVDGLGEGWQLHPVQADGADPMVKDVAVEGDRLTVPARTTAVFVAPQ